MNAFRARHHVDGRWVRIEVDGATIAAVEPVEGPAEISPVDDWVGPAFWDIQTNGRFGISFSDAALTVEQVIEVVRAQRALGTARLCPTLITASVGATRHGVSTIAEACRAAPDVGAMVAGIHLEGPSISERDGYRGAHPLDAVRDPDPAEFDDLQAASGGRIAIVTLAPERRGAIPFIAKLAGEGVLVAVAHSAADRSTLEAAVAAGARLATHLGNGVTATLARHPNPIWDQAALDGLSASFIADGHHLDDATLRVLTRAKGRDRTILVSDASPLAGLPTGAYGPWAVDSSGKIVVAGTPYLAGSNQGLDVGVATLIRATGCSMAEALEAATARPAWLIGRIPTRVVAGEPANLIRFRIDPTFRLMMTCVDGLWTFAREPQGIHPP